MISDQRILAVLPKVGFVHDYVKYASSMTDAPLAFHLATALSLLGTIAPIALQKRHGNDVHAAMWVMLVGPSGRSRKTTCIHLGEEILRNAAPEMIGQDPGSKEQFLDAMIQQPQQLLILPELGEFLEKTTGKSNYLSPMRTLFTKLWDAKVVERPLVHRDESAEDPRLSLLGGVTPGFLEEHTRATDWMDGFLSRWFIVHADRDPRNVKANPSKKYASLFPKLVARLQQMQKTYVGFCTGFTPEAEAYWNAWYNALTVRFEDGTMRWASGCVERVQNVAIKATMLFCLDIGEIGGDNAQWRIDLVSLKAGIAVAELHLDSVLEIVSGLAGSLYGRMRQTVIGALSLTQARTKGQIFAFCNPKVNPKDVMVILEALREEGRVERSGSDLGDTFWRLLPEAPHVSAAPAATEALPSNVVAFPSPSKSTRMPDSASSFCASSSEQSDQSAVSDSSPPDASHASLTASAVGNSGASAVAVEVLVVEAVESWDPSED